MGKLTKQDGTLVVAISTILWLILSIFSILVVFQACNIHEVQNEGNILIKSKPSIAVLPFQDMSSDKSQEYFGDGIAEEILNTLANIEGIKVAGRTSSFSFKNKETTIEAIGKALKVEHVLEGSVRREDDKIRITAQLIKVSDGFHLWSHKYDRDFKDVFKIQDEVAQNIGQVLFKKIAPKQLSKLKKQPAQNSEAYGLFLRAKHIHLNRYYGNYNLVDFELSERLFLEAIEIDSNYALAYAGLADLYDSHKDALSDPVALKKYDHLKIKYVEKAWQLNPDLPYVNIVRGWVMRNKKVEPNDLDAAYESFLRGFQLNPSSTDGLFALAFLHEDKSLFADANKLLDKAIEIDPLRSASFTVKADFLMRIGQYDLANKTILEALTVNPTDLYALSQLAMNHAFLKNNKKALEVYQQINQIDSAYLKKSVIDNKIYAVVRGDIVTARKIPTSLLDYRGENVIVNSLIGETDSLETSFLAWWDWFKNFKGERSMSQSSSYLEFQQNPIYASLKEKPWFQKVVSEEKEKYDRFIVNYPRAETLLTKTINGTTESEIIASNKSDFLKKYGFYLGLLFLLLIVIGYYFWLKKERSSTALEVETPTKIAESPILESKSLDPFLIQLNEVVEANLNKSDFGIPHLCKAMGLSRAQLYRKVKTLADTSPALYIRSLRLKKAKELLANSDLNISEIAYEVGFNDLSYFSRSFSEEFGESPSETRK